MINKDEKTFPQKGSEGLGANSAVVNAIRRYMIIGERRTSNYWWACIVLLGSCGFLLSGVSAYYGSSFIPFLNVKDLSFFPQGLLMSFYGSLGFPGKNRRIDLSYSLKDVEAIKVELKQGLDAQRTIYLKLKGKREIPLTGIGDPLTLKEIEKQASELANFLQVSLEGL